MAAVLVTHNSAHWIAETLASVLDQETAVDRLVIVDDHSADNTLSIVREHAGQAAVEILTSTSSARDVHTRIAHNFVQGVQCADAEFVFLGDHDDVWHRHRVTSQLQALLASPQTALLASDGRVVREGVGATEQTLRDVFPVPPEFSDWPSSRQFTFVVRHSVATGGACALRPSAFTELKVPDGWLHDRWWSLWAAAHGRLLVDPTIVIDYRISEGQQLGLDTAAQADGSSAWLAHHLGNALRTSRRVIDLAPLFMASR